MSPLEIGPFNLAPLLPLVLLGLGGLALLLVDAFLPATRPRIGFAATAFLVAALAFTAGATHGDAPFPGMLLADACTRFFDCLLIGAALVTALLSLDYLDELQRGEYWALLLFATAGMMIVVHAANFLTVFLGLETLSLALYVLTGFRRGRERAVEAALKYFFLGAFAAAFLVYGMALIYGTTGTLEIGSLAVRIASGRPPALALAGLALLLVGLAFKVSAVPFHMWTPDVYEAAPTPIVGFMSVATKAAAFAALLRILVVGLTPLSAGWTSVAAALAFLSMLTGNFVALSQRSLKRMLAFSSIAHAGYILVGIAAWGAGGKEAVLFYLAAYGLMNLGAFAVLSSLERQGEGILLYDLSGLAKRRPWTAAAMALFMLSLAGVPATAGFVGKFYLFYAAVQAGWVKLALFAVVYSAVAAYYYLRVIVVMYMHAPPKAVADGDAAPVLPVPEFAPPRLAATLVLALTAAGVLVFGLLPSPLLDWVNSAAQSLAR